jgi:hypothetical protein
VFLVTTFNDESDWFHGAPKVFLANIICSIRTGTFNVLAFATSFSSIWSTYMVASAATSGWAVQLLTGDR